MQVQINFSAQKRQQIWLKQGVVMILKSKSSKVQINFSAQKEAKKWAKFHMQ